MPKVRISQTSWQRFTATLLADDHEGEQAADILPAIPSLRSPLRPGQAPSLRSRLVLGIWFLAKTKAKEALNRSFWQAAPFVTGDPTE